MNSIAVSMGNVTLACQFKLLLSVSSVENFLDHIIILFSLFSGTSTLLCMRSELIYFPPTVHINSFFFTSSLTHFVNAFLILTILTGVMCYLILLICIFFPWEWWYEFVLHLLTIFVCLLLRNSSWGSSLVLCFVLFFLLSLLLLFFWLFNLFTLELLSPYHQHGLKIIFSKSSLHSTCIFYVSRSLVSVNSTYLFFHVLFWGRDHAQKHWLRSVL